MVDPSFFKIRLLWNLSPVVKCGVFLCAKADVLLPFQVPLTKEPPEASILVQRGWTHGVAARGTSDELREARIIKVHCEAGTFFKIL